MVGKKGPRKLLVASVGVATINYVLAGCDSIGGPTVANLMPAPVAGAGAGGKGGGGGGGGTPPTVANLPFPIPMGGYPTAGNAGQNNSGNGGASAGSSNDAGGGGEPSSGGAGGAP